ncbi:MAG: hypothetical protein A2126_02295 [Candidatus Woykebacteria bacterium GWB1_45_5]|uniref:Antitoxin n=2 Tax=Microgenomates group TaxID=1794810 RepID=A0A0G1Q2Z7_9BACT|nr:MAG: Antitoxin [Candidatus Woesebacteria bacterium GW2011_GWA1_45_8]OGY23656.1 MAG: hypothetical protein A2126_02295 [Candidatus Woykebacteria bacterium GWB1_45_5]
MVTRLNISIPTETATKLKKIAPKRGVSSFLASAAEEKISRIEREKALKELLEAPPAFTDIKDSVKYIRKMRRLDEKRMKRLGI